MVAPWLVRTASGMEARAEEGKSLVQTALGGEAEVEEGGRRGGEAGDA